MNHQNQNQVLTIFTSNIVDPEAFEALRLDAYKNGNGHRADLLTGLSEATDFDGRRPYPDEIGKTGLAGVVYDVVMDDDEKIVDIFKREILEEDTKVTATRRRMQHRLPSGPSQNGIHVRVAFRPRRSRSQSRPKKLTSTT